MNKTLYLLGLILMAQTISCTGGVHNIDVSEPTINQQEPVYSVGGPKNHLDKFNPETSAEDRLAFETILNHINSNGDVAATGYRFNKVEKLTIQLVAGKKYDFVLSFVNPEGELRYFEVTVWVKLWESFAQVTSFKELEGFQEEEQIYGGEVARELDIVNNANDARVYETALNSLQLHMFGANEYTVKEVSNASIQIVSGTIYQFDVTFSNQNINVDRTFTVKVILIPWENVCEVISVEEKRSAEPVLNQYGSAETYAFDIENNPVDQLIFGAVHAKAMTTIGSENSGWEFLEIRNGTRQIVSGSVYNFDIVFRNLNQEERAYHASVYVVPWENIFEIQSFDLIY